MRRDQAPYHCPSSGVLRETGSFQVTGWASSTRWPKREHPLVPTTGFREALLQLRRLGWLQVDVSGDTASISYGKRIRERAKGWRLELPAAR